ncbi:MULTISPECIES: DUF294 nucleotidyltransferase-like domain-containing protein [Gammaproteobacteria]|uniref:DUF294 nucleotidyltransferase-like domain-containing protein n=1 Tax=Gammaproteobacteria TaxID=1236 RepID=UPI000DCFEA36|nr:MULTISPECIES: DUF294 nucleotidyltransferase-like domain-containing protein [Gammaproteobacteria]RTE86106.1 cyclic nucleotide-binding/CBS domain-containing protein [Aliidiomarina sp. B3213]TCZ91459.1 cyclic nucleotide-binding/CBS domain-containing protein [Lysobacter sp. N42]
MEAEHLEILDFLKQHAPFNELPDEEVERLSQLTDVAYFKAGSDILSYQQRIEDLHVVRSGAVEVYHRNGDLYNRLSSGGFFGEAGLLRNGKVRYPVTSLEDSLIYLVPGTEFNRLFDDYESFADAVETEDRERLKRALDRRASANDMLTATIETLVYREPIGMKSSGSIREAAEMMTEQEVSSLLIYEEDQEDPDKPLGIITDKDLRKRVLAVGLSDQTAVKEIMSEGIVCVQHNQRIFEAMLMMLRSNLHHLPVLKKGKTIGVVALSDVVRHESKSSLFVVGNIFRATTVEELEALKDDVKATFVKMVDEDANSRMIGSSMAVIGRSFKQRLLELGEEKLGPPPVPYCFLALGSMARDEQSIVTDQDNAMILHDSFNPKEHDAYFLELAQFVSDGLASCGYTYCTGDIMATNKKWRQPLRVWKEYFDDWIEEPTPERLLHSSIFFDLDGVWGKLDFAEQLNRLIRQKAPKNKRFLACMARNALQRTPPLGFFKDFVMEKDGKHNNAINTKRRGTAPVADLIRVHALAIGSKERNSFARLEDVVDASILTPGRGPDLRDALELISMVRIRHQALSLTQGEIPDNNVEPEALSDFERKNLRDAFQILSNAQKFLKFRYSLS